MSVQTLKKQYGRLNVRLTAKSKERISKAAYILGQDLTEFTETTLDERAREVIAKYESFELTQAEKSDLFALLDAPAAKPTKRSLLAEKKYKEMIDSGKLVA